MRTTGQVRQPGVKQGRWLHHVLLGTASITAFGVAPPAAAQQAPPAAADPATGGLPQDDIVVTAQRRAESVQDVPISIAVLTGETLDRQATGGALEALLQVPGISQSSSDAGNLTQVSIRGVSPGVPFGAGSATVGYYLDSIPFGLVRGAIVPNPNVYDLSRVEVLRGPQGTLYGASALNGVVRILTNDADVRRFEFKARGGMSFTDGGNPSFRADAAINVPLIEDRLALRVVAGVEELGGWIEQPRRNKTNANNARSRNLRIKLAALPFDNLRVDLTAWFARDAYDAGNYADDDNTQPTTVPQPGVTDFKAYNAKVALDLPFMSVTSATSYLNFKQEIFSDFSYVTGGAIQLQLFSDTPTKIFTEELVFNSVGEGPWRWSAGFFYRDADTEARQTLPIVLPGTLASRDASLSYAAFGELTRRFADGRFELTAGLRYFHDKSETDTLPDGFLPVIQKDATFEAVTPRVVATWLPSRSFTAYASYSQGFRSGLNQGPLALLAAPDLPVADADKLHNYEVGAKGTLFGGRARFEAAAFYVQWDDIQQIAQVLFNGAYATATVNGSSASGAGAEATLALSPFRGAEIGGSFSYNDLRFDEDVTQPTPNPANPAGPPIIATLYPKGARTAFSPSTTASAFASYGFALNQALDARLNVSATFRSRQELRIAVGTGSVASATYRSGRPLILNASFDIATKDDKSLSIFAQNLTNWNEITIPGPVIPTLFRYRPRTIGIQFDAKF